MSRRAVALLIVMAVGLSLGACHRPVAGEACRETGRGTCVDSTHALTCRSYAWHLDACRGPGGCHEAGSAAACDATIASAHDSCEKKGQTACSVDKKEMLSCDGTTFSPISSCEGPNGCVPGESGATCDARVAREGDACVSPIMRSLTDVVPPPATACTPEKDAKLTCVEGTFELHERCRGPGGCTLSDHGASCDASVGEAGDPCNWFWVACGRDGILGQNYDEMRASTHTRCKLMITDQNRDQYGYACTADGKALLKCGSQSGGSRAVQSFTIASRCPHSCRVTEASWECS